MTSKPSIDTKMGMATPTPPIETAATNCHTSRKRWVTDLVDWRMQASPQAAPAKDTISASAMTQ